MPIRFFIEVTNFKLANKNKYKSWLREIANEEGYSIGNLNYIFCSDEYLYAINVRYLNHDTYTDIITFDQGENPNEISGEIYISIDRVKENANFYEEGFEKEINRVISHGLLHLCGYSDKNKIDQNKMRIKEEKSLDLLDRKI